MSFVPARRPMTPADVRRQVVVEELDLARDGTLAVVARRSSPGDRRVTHVYAFPLDQERIARPWQLTSGTVHCPADRPGRLAVGRAGHPDDRVHRRPTTGGRPPASATVWAVAVDDESTGPTEATTPATAGSWSTG